MASFNFEKSDKFNHLSLFWRKKFKSHDLLHIWNIFEKFIKNSDFANLNLYKVKSLFLRRFFVSVNKYQIFFYEG